ncbi:MAG TPA: glutaredoxin domain-containing protein [Candidatus Baltobacteraceae bacterium]|jgi:glutaredoxin 3|nr:glutaredoxin domain-containing protein [Candidatus Baltobacteraceae bacterium]
MAQKADVERIPPGSKVELYISPTCPYCRAAMQHYDDAGTPYIVHDAQNDRGARAKMFSYTGGDPTVPAIVVDGTYVQSGWGSPPSG